MDCWKERLRQIVIDGAAHSDVARQTRDDVAYALVEIERLEIENAWLTQAVQRQE